MKIDWYFDFISPFAYLQFHLINTNHPEFELNCIPVLFSGLLKHNSHKGPAEIPSKRVITYQYCQWYAEQNSIPFRFPEVHPFHPILPLRLAIAHNSSRKITADIFDFIWARGLDLNNPDNLAKFCEEHQINDVEKLVSDQTVKDALKSNTERAAEDGVFGVPTLQINNRLFWGVDMLDMAASYIDDPDLFETSEYQRLGNLPNGLW